MRLKRKFKRNLAIEFLKLRPSLKDRCSPLQQKIIRYLKKRRLAKSNKLLPMSKFIRRVKLNSKDADVFFKTY